MDPRQRNVALLVAGCFFMEMLDGTIVTTAAPELGEALGVSATSISVVISAYLLSLAMLVPLSGWLTRRFGARVIFLSAIAIFTVASLGCALSTNLAMLILMRVLQGAGGAMMVPVGQALVMGRTEKKDIMRVASYIIWPGLIAPVIAPLAGALIVTYLSWHWMFLINIPLGIIAFFFAWRLIVSDPPQPVPPLDWLGLLLASSGVGLLTWVAHLISESGAGWQTSTILLAISIILLTLAGRHMMRHDHPLLRLDLFGSVGYRTAQLGGSLYRITVSATPFLLPLLFQTAYGWSAVKSGAIVLFIFAGNVGIKPATTPLINRFGYRPIILVSAAGLVVTTVLLGVMTKETPLILIVVVTFLCGVFRSVGFSAYFTVGYADLPKEAARDASTLSATLNQVTQGLAVAIATVALFIGERVDAEPSTRPFSIAFVLMALFAVIAIVQAFRLDPQVGNEARTVRGKPKPATS